MSRAMSFPVTRELVIALISLAVVFYGVVLLWYFINEDRLIFAPDRGLLLPPAEELRLESRDVSIRNADGLRLMARVIPPPEAVAQERAAWLLYLHGSSGSLGLPAYNEAWAEFHRQGLGVIAVDYRGFGESEGAISELGIYQDAQAAYDYLRDELLISSERILIYGFSMGAAVAIDLATRVPAAGLLVEGAWLSIPQLAKERHPYLPVAFLVRNRFASVDKIAQVAMPKLFLHARLDSKIPLAHGLRLFELATGQKEFHELSGDHGTSHKADCSFFLDVRRFIAARDLPLALPSSQTSGELG